MRRILQTLALTTALSVSWGARPAPAQVPTAPGEDPELADRVVAIVGDSIILLSQVREQMFFMERQGARFPTDSAQLRQAMRDVLENLVDVQLMLQAASRDSTLIPDSDRIDALVEQQVQRVQSQFPTTQAFQEALARDGMTAATYRDQIRTQIRQNQIQQLFLQRRVAAAPPVAITEAEMRELFEAQRASIQEERPELLSLEQVIVRPTAPDSAWDEARATADSLLVELRAGADFAAMAEQVSDDPGSAAQGGDLGWFRRGNMVPEFEAVAFRLRDGVVSDPVRTSFGWHLIKVERSRPGEVKARHILVRPEATADDMARARGLAEALADSIRAGASVERLADTYGEEDQSWRFQVSRDQLEGELPPGYADALGEAAEGDVVGPFETVIREPALAVVRVVEIREGGEFTFDDVRETIRGRLQERKKIERILEQLRERAYVDIRF